MKSKIAVTLVAIILNGCAATGDDYIPGVRPAVEIHPIFGNLTIQESDLIGPDANQNGVRDEIDKTVRMTFSNSRGQEAASRYAREVSKSMIAGLNNQTPSDVQKLHYVEAMVCLDSMASGTSNILLRQTIRTPNRADAMSKWRQLAGTLPSASCDTATAAQP